MRSIESTLLHISQTFNSHTKAQQKAQEDASFRPLPPLLDVFLVVIAFVSGLSAACGSERMRCKAQERPQ
jgi:hypothetical protein